MGNGVRPTTKDKPEGNFVPSAMPLLAFCMLHFMFQSGQPVQHLLTHLIHYSFPI